MQINFLRHNEIDRKNWDRCIDNSLNALPYAYSWYLDIVSNGQWDAIIIDDYAAVFPIPFKNRLIYKQVYQPFFTQQLGLFYTDKLYHTKLPDVLKALPASYRKIHLHLNIENDLGEVFSAVEKRVTHHIDLNKSYQSIASDYNEQIRRNLKKSLTHHLQVETSSDVNILISLREMFLQEALKGKQSAADTDRLKKLIQAILDNKKGEIKFVRGAENDIQAAVCLLQSNGYIIYLSSVSSDVGKANHAMTFLIDDMLKSNANTQQTFDFEGSMIPGIARYFKGFGGKEKWFSVIQK
ncbi:MAG TPA: hypothetical protein PK511_04570 [Chitinophagales bacterium]|nr:hypothetical protein [Chitinophagales bacterium]HMX04759.1 hypothetical protein [Chitinophagales bacterium]HMZ88214.1 hypothetical protein [Chitinophagales bacterium]HNE44617.1 hypothetical protein [Chitinophagales bacterium]HNF68423.1 hypothetical protein [Chitinophagales bacterium]